MSKLNTPWSLDADAVRDNTGRIVVETINCGETFAEEIVKCVNGYADLEAEIKQADSDVERIEIDSSMIPEGAVLLEAYLHEGALVVMHEEALGELGEEHNCDAMGCGTGSHVWARIPLVMSRTAELEAELDALKARVEQEVAEETSMSGYVVMPYSGTTCGHWCIRCGKPIGHEAYWINDVGPICTGCDKSP